MSVWDSYDDRINKSGSTRYEASLKREKRLLSNRMMESLSFHSVSVYTPENTINVDSQESAASVITQDVAIINSDNLNEKTLITLPDQDIESGSMVYWKGYYWLVAERDANTTVYTKAKLLQCNHLLKWVSDDKEIMKQWCVIEDGTKYLIGEYEDRQFIVTRGDSRIAMTISRNSETVKFGRTRRFLVDDPESPQKLAYSLTKPLKLGAVYNQKGIFKFVLQEVTSTADDNQELGIADYYKFFPSDNVPEHHETVPGTNKRMWL